MLFSCSRVERITDHAIPPRSSIITVSLAGVGFISKEAGSSLSRILRHYSRIKLPYAVTSPRRLRPRETNRSSAVDTFPPCSSAAVKTRDAFGRGFSRRGDASAGSQRRNRPRRTADFCHRGEGKKNRRRADARAESQEIPRFFRAVSAYGRTADLILIRGVVFWGSRANRGPSMIRPRRHESGISPSRGLERSGSAVSCFLLRPFAHFLAFCLLFRFSPVCHLSSVFSLSLSLSLSLISLFPSSRFGFSSARPRDSNETLVSPFYTSLLFCFLFDSPPHPSRSPSYTYVSLSALCFFMLG